MELVRSHLSAATRSNDFSSPTVVSDFDEDFFNLYVESTSPTEYIELSDAFNNLIYSIRHIK